ncbi:swr complex subunit [Madurella fahalii]|uniref:SWR1-complex protein 4 n=1 Tax=Madurella fahalii TaxID=1157608 RepID=A0ABQ0GEV8_9PEZI
MTSHDVRDVLNLPSDSPAPRPSKKQKTSTPRPNLKGLAREVQNLGGDNPIAIVPEVSFFKKRRFASRKPAARWELKAFTNSARGDGGSLVLRHWKRKTEDGPPPDPAQDAESRPGEDGVDGETKDDKPEDSAFAKFNVRVAVPQYNQDQYQSNLQSNDWTKEETDYLMELAREYDLRWAIIWDRYDFTPKPATEEGANGTSTAVVPAPKARTMEDLKARYYEVAAKMMAVQKPAQYMTRPEFELYEMMQSFNPEQERKRKEFALNTMSRSKDEAREEESLLLEIKRILARTERFNEERRELYNRLDFPATDSDINSFKSSAGLQSLLQTLMSTDKSKKRKSIMGGTAGAEGVTPVPGSAVSETGPGHNRRESIAALASDGGRGAPTTPAEPTPTTATSLASNKKKGGAQQPERRKLSAQEEQVYGVSFHDRLGSGPTFRYEKINKLYSHKSGQQQMRITNALAELDVPARLVMPTAAVTAQFEVLWGAVTALVDLRKVSDKLDAEIKVEEAKKAERDKARGVSGGGGSGGSGGQVGKNQGEASKGAAAAEPGAAAGEKEKQKDEEGLVNGDGGGGSAAATTAAAAADGDQSMAETNGGDAAAADSKNIKEEEEPAARPASSGGAHKRSASVLSSTSDKSAKRQKK